MIFPKSPFHFYDSEIQRNRTLMKSPRHRTVTVALCSFHTAISGFIFLDLCNDKGVRVGLLDRVIGEFSTSKEDKYAADYIMVILHKQS